MVWTLRAKLGTVQGNGRRVVSQAVVVAIGVAADGHRGVLGFEVGETASQPFWTSFLWSLKARGLGCVKLVIYRAAVIPDAVLAWIRQLPDVP